jgi:transcription elongation factor GreA
MQKLTVDCSEVAMVKSSPVYLTREGANRLRQDLDRLVNVERRIMIERLHEAAEDGDLLENDEYLMAKADEEFLEWRIRELDVLLRDPVIIEEGQRANFEVALGSRVTVFVEGEDGPETFIIVGRAECDPDNGRISNESPIGSALMGRKVGESVGVQTPESEIILKIVAIG